MDDVLTKANLAVLKDRFRAERVEPETVERMRDEELIRLGVCTIGERIRLRNICKNTVSEGNNAPVSRTVASTVLQERMTLFNSRSKTRGRGGKRGRQERPRTLTALFVCLADRHQTRIPTSTKKQILHQAGLGLKKIKLESSDTEQEVLKKVTSSEQDETGQILGFPQLKDAGGFEILHCVSNCKDLLPITCSWSVCDLKANLGPQTKLYLRPVQKSLSIKSSTPNNKCKVMEKCLSCHKEILVRELRQHMFTCKLKNSVPLYEESDSDEELPPFSFTESSVMPVRESQVHAIPAQPTSAQLTSVQLTSAQPTSVQTTVTQITSVQNALPTVSLELQMLDSPTEVIDVEQLSNNEIDPSSLKEAVEKVINYCKGNDVSDPVEILRCLQKEVVIGRQLEISDLSENIEGSTSYLLVDRENSLSTAFEELDSIDNYRLTLQVQFYGEEADDYGGPRKEFFNIALREIYDKYFNNGIKDHISEDYFKVGIILGLSTLQNGEIPRFSSEEILLNVLQSSNPISPAIQCLQKGLEATGLLQVCRSLPSFLYLFRPGAANMLTLRKLISLLKPNFSEVGSNKRKFENEVYTAFSNYLREAARRRRGNVTLGHVLQFATGTDEEPMLGFAFHPSLSFFPVEVSFLPQSNTCTNTLRLPCGSLERPLLTREQLFLLYDYAFCNTYFGNV